MQVKKSAIQMSPLTLFCFPYSTDHTNNPKSIQLIMKNYNNVFQICSQKYKNIFSQAYCRFSTFLESCILLGRLPYRCTWSMLPVVHSLFLLWTYHFGYLFIYFFFVCLFVVFFCTCLFYMSILYHCITFFWFQLEC